MSLIEPPRWGIYAKLLTGTSSLNNSNTVSIATHCSIYLFAYFAGRIICLLKHIGQYMGPGPFIYTCDDFVEGYSGAGPERSVSE